MPLKKHLIRKKKELVPKLDSESKRPRIFKILILLYFILMIAFIAYHFYYANKVIPGITVDGINVSGKSAEQTYETLKGHLNPVNKVTLNINGKDIEVNAQGIDFKYLPVETAKNAFSQGRGGAVPQNLYIKLKGLFKKTDLAPKYEYNEEKLEQLVERLQNENLTKVQEASFIYLPETDELSITGGKSGQIINKTNFKENLLKSFLGKNDSYIKVELYDVQPTLTLEDLDEIKSQMEDILDVKYSFVHEDSNFEVTNDELLKFVKPIKENGVISLEIDEHTLSEKVEQIALTLDRNPRGQVLEIENGKAVKFISSESGLKVAIKESVNSAKGAILDKNPTLKLEVAVTNPPETDNEYGIEEMIGEGKSWFKGSIPGRVHNIELAASRVSGTLVAPGEDFSFVEAVGEISKNTGYTSAYIISKGRTVLGDGGGVCQVSTTVFRAALDAGLPIVERNAHAYRVGYYEQNSPVGLDATIYSPSVDLKFRNDTDHYILISADFNKENSSLVFKIYGKNDGRTVEMTEPKILSRSSPPAPIYIDNSSLAKGVTKQIEHAVGGAKVSFTRLVKDATGNVMYDDTFKSNYRAWGAVYEVGTR